MRVWLMPTNLFNKEHKATSEKYREGYDRITWEKQGEENAEQEPNASDKQ